MRFDFEDRSKQNKNKAMSNEDVKRRDLIQKIDKYWKKLQPLEVLNTTKRTTEGLDRVEQGLWILFDSFEETSKTRDLYRKELEIILKRYSKEDLPGLKVLEKLVSFLSGDKKEDADALKSMDRMFADDEFLKIIH